MPETVCHAPPHQFYRSPITMTFSANAWSLTLRTEKITFCPGSRTRRFKTSDEMKGTLEPPKEGPQFYERSQTLVVNAHGALMALAEKVTPKRRLLMQNIHTGEQKECRVVYIEKVPMGPSKVAVEFTRPAPSFWRIAYPPADWTVSISK